MFRSEKINCLKQIKKFRNLNTRKNLNNFTKKNINTNNNDCEHVFQSIKRVAGNSLLSIVLVSIVKIHIEENIYLAVSSYNLPFFIVINREYPISTKSCEAIITVFPFSIRSFIFLINTSIE